MSQLPIDCLDEIFEYLKGNKVTLRSCLLVNRLWCEVSVRILWRNVWTASRQLNTKASLILRVLLACLPNESKELLYKNKIFIPTPTSRSLLFNYVMFCKALSIFEVRRVVHDELRYLSITSLSQNDLVSGEIIKMFMQISPLKILSYYSYTYVPEAKNISFTCFPGPKDCLANLSELQCSTDIRSEFFHHLSRITHNLQSLCIKFENNASNELIELISLQNNLK